MKFAEITTGGSYFKGEDYEQAVALLVEVNSLTPSVATNYGPKDTIEADITSFATVEDIANDNGTLSLGVKIQQTDLARKLAHLVGAATVVTVEKLPKTPKLPNGAWVWRSVDASVRDAVIAYAERREAAEAEALSEMPDFNAA